MIPENRLSVGNSEEPTPEPSFFEEFITPFLTFQRRGTYNEFNEYRGFIDFVDLGNGWSFGSEYIYGEGEILEYILYDYFNNKYYVYIDVGEVPLTQLYWPSTTNSAYQHLYEEKGYILPTFSEFGQKR